MCLYHRAIVVNIDDKTGQVVAFTMHQSESVGWAGGTKTEVLSELQAVLQLLFPEFNGGFDGFEGNHSDGDAAVAHLSGTQKAVATVKHLYPVADEGVF